jgi:glucose 1-dehydrogenase
MKLENRVALVTGAARGIGLAIARRFIAEGAKVVIADIDEKAGVEALAELGENGLFVACDVGDRNAVDAAVTATVERFGAIDILVNNAGIIHTADFLEISEWDFDRVLRVNLKGAFLAGQRAAKEMVRQAESGRKPGTIINLSSVNSVVAIPNQVPYAISKGGIQQLTRVMALALAPNAIGPGSIATDILAGVAKDRAAKKRLLSRTPMQRIGSPDEIAGVAAFLASADASYISGETIFADGGRLALNYVVDVRDEALD